MQTSNKAEEGMVAPGTGRADVVRNRQLAELERRIVAAAAAHHAPQPEARRTTSRVLGYVLLGWAVLALAGVVMDLTLGQHFMSITAEHDREPARRVLGRISALFSVLLITHDQRAGTVDLFALLKAPRALAGYLLKVAILTAPLTALTIAAPWGWAALGGRLFGSHSGPMWGTVTSLEPQLDSWQGCHVGAGLLVRGVAGHVCLDGRLSGAMPRAGDRVAVTGRVSALGIYVDQVQGLPR